MMHKRTLHSLLIVSFIAVFAASMSFAADEVVVESKPGLPRCVSQSVNVTANIDAPVSAIEIVLNVSSLSDCGDLEDLSVEWALDGAVLADRVIDLSMAPLIRFAAMSTGQEPDYLEQGGVVAVIGFTTADCCGGVAQIAGATWPSEPPFGEIVTQYVDAATGALISPVPVTAGEVGILNAAPTMDEITDGPFTILHGELFTLELSAVDADVANGCESLTYFVENGPEGMEISGTTLSWQTDGDDVCEFDGDIVIGVRDKYPCLAEDLAEPFTICVTNNPPVVDVYPTELVELAWGMTYTTTIEASDPDPGPYGPIYHIVNWGYAADPPTIHAETGELEWVTQYESDYTGTFTVEVEVNDGANVCDCAPVNSASITFDIEVVPFQLTIEKVEGAYLGQQHVVSITMLDRTYVNKEIGGFDFLIKYDNSVMSFMFASEGDFLTDCKWEYFTYRYGANGNCGPGACPTGVLRVVAMGETQGGNIADHPDCYTNDPLVVPGVSNELVKLHFLLSTDANLECQFASIRWVWYDCADNGVSSRVGDFLFISDKVYDFGGTDQGGAIWNDITGADGTLPTLTGAPAPECDVETDKGHPWRLVHFYNGGIDIACAIDLDDVGDININKIAYEIADAVMFTNYFVEGLSAFGSHVEGSIQASDTNKDGITLSVADLVYLIRVIVGDAQPYAKEINVTTVPGTYTHDAGRVAIPEIQVGGVALVVDGNVTPSADGLNVTYAQADGQTRILVTGVYEEDSGVMNSFTGNFLNGINGQIISIDAADVAGNPIALKNVPANYGLSQNYPNPFNPTTKIEVMMPEAGDYTLAIYNVQGQLVQVFNGRTDGAEKVEIDWNASNLASGIYLYKLTAGEFTSVKKAVLLK